MIISEFTVLNPIDVEILNEFIEFLKVFRDEAKSITIENYMNHDNIRETVLEMKILTVLVKETFGEYFHITEPIILGEDIGDISRKIVIRLHDNITELQWKE